MQSCFKVWLKLNFFDKKKFDYNYNLILPNILLLITSVFTFSYDTKNKSNNYSFLSLLPNLPLYPFHHILRILRVPTFRQ